jgi:hypothetical protein
MQVSDDCGTAVNERSICGNVRDRPAMFRQHLFLRHMVRGLAGWEIIATFKVS